MMAFAVKGEGIADEDLQQYLLGFYGELRLTEDPRKFLPCADNEVGQVLEGVAKSLNGISLIGKTNVLLGFETYLQPAMLMVASGKRCSSPEIKKLHQQIQTLVLNAPTFLQKLSDNQDIIARALHKLLEYWQLRNYQAAGQISGALLDWIFLH